jgi:hypothetical protein
MVDMLYKIIYLAILLFVASGYGNNALAMPLKGGGGCAPERKDASFYAQAEMRTSTSLFPVSEKSNQESKTEKLKDLTDDLKRLEKKIEKKILKEVWPRIKQEIDRLRKRLREFQRGT